MEDNQKFSYSYVAPSQEERREIEHIKRQYSAQIQDISGIERLRQLDGKVKKGATVVSVTLGVLGCLVFGLGLSLILEFYILSFGLICGFFGGVMLAMAYPTYKIIFKIQSKKYGEEIIRLSNELLSR